MSRGRGCLLKLLASGYRMDLSPAIVGVEDVCARDSHMLVDVGKSDSIGVARAPRLRLLEPGGMAHTISTTMNPLFFCCTLAVDSIGRWGHLWDVNPWRRRED